VYFNVNFNVLFKLIKVHLLVSELYTAVTQNVKLPRVHDKRTNKPKMMRHQLSGKLSNVTN